MRACRTYQKHSEATVPARRRPYGRHNDPEACSAPNPWRDVAQGVHDAAEWKAALISAGHGTREVDMKLVKTLRRHIWVQTRHAIELSLAGRLWPGVLSCCPTPETRVFEIHGEPSEGKWTSHRVRQGVLKQDVLVVAAQFAREGYTVAVLNMASARSPGGGVQQGAGAQEEDLHRRTDLCRFTLLQSTGRYPIPVHGCLVSEGVTILRGPEEEGYPWLRRNAMQKVCVISCVALCLPPLQASCEDYACEDSRHIMKVKAMAVIQAAVAAKCHVVVLSAFGCGAYRNPPHSVAALFHEALKSSGIMMAVFCILEDHNAFRDHNPQGNFEPFQQVFGDFQMPPEMVGVDVGCTDRSLWGERREGVSSSSSWRRNGWRDNNATRQESGYGRSDWW